MSTNSSANRLCEGRAQFRRKTIAARELWPAMYNVHSTCSIYLYQFRLTDGRCYTCRNVSECIMCLCTILLGLGNGCLPVSYRTYTVPHCWKSNPNFRDIIWNVVENMIKHEFFCVVSRFPRYISCYIAESPFPLGQCRWAHKISGSKLTVQK